MNIRVALVVLSCALSLATGFAVSRSGGSASPSGKRARPLIGLSMDTLKEERWLKDRDLLVAKTSELGADLLVQAANGDDTRQIQDIEALLSRGVDVLIVVPHNGAAMAKAVTLAHDAGVPVISYDRLITGADVDLYVSFDSVAVGEAQARFLLERLKAKGPGKRRVVRIHGAKTDNNALLFKQGQDNLIKPAIARGEIEVVHEDWAENWTPENAKKIMNAALTRHGNAVDGVLAANDGTAGGAIQALLEEGLAGKVVVTGQDAELAACQRIMAGTQAVTIYKPVRRIAAEAAEAAFKLAKGKPVIALAQTDNGKVKVPSIMLAVVAVTKDNMNETIVRDGVHTAAELGGAGAK